jgi:hypothetical protein
MSFLPFLPFLPFLRLCSVLCRMGPETGTPEVVCQSQKNGIITSGGGFSDKIATPSWQVDSVNYYFTQAVGSAAPQPGYNAGGRGQFLIVISLFFVIICCDFNFRYSRHLLHWSKLLRSDEWTFLYLLWNFC